MDESMTHDRIAETLRTVAAALRDAGIPFLLGGSFAVWARGGPRTQNDLDVMVPPDRVGAAVDALVAAGLRFEPTPEEWLEKVWDDTVMVDLITTVLGTGEITEELVARAERMSVLALQMPVMAVEDVLTAKLLALSEQHLDYSGLLHMSRALRERIDWQGLWERTHASPYARGFFALASELGIVDVPDRLPLERADVRVEDDGPAIASPPPPPAPLLTPDGDGAGLRIAAVGDLHCHEGRRETIARCFNAIAQDADVLLIAGDLTTHGLPEQAAVLADAVRDAGIPVVAVLGNHDHHGDAAGEIAAVLRDAGVVVLDPGHEILCLDGVDVGIVGAKGFVGGFVGSHLSGFGERSLRDMYDETTAEVEALEAGLQAVAHCPVRLVLLHYAPIEETLHGEPRTIWMMLGADRLAAPILAHQPDLVVHGHAHAGAFAGRIGETPVHNVSVPVIDRPYAVFALPTAARLGSPLH